MALFGVQKNDTINEVITDTCNHFDIHGFTIESFQTFRFRIKGFYLTWSSYLHVTYLFQILLLKEIYKDVGISCLYFRCKGKGKPMSWMLWVVCKFLTQMVVYFLCNAFIFNIPLYWEWHTGTCIPSLKMLDFVLFISN